MKKLNLLWLVILLSTACNQQTDKVEVNDSTRAARELQEADSATLFTSGVYDWIQQTLKRNDTTNVITLEENWQEEPVMVTAFEGNKQFYKDYESVLRWSPDSTYIIDIGSYGTVLTKGKNGETIMQAGEPDSELALIEPGKNTRKRLMFVGPSSQILDAKWINNHEVTVIGTFDTTGNNTNDTLLWMINVQRDQFRLYNIKSHH